MANAIAWWPTFSLGRTRAAGRIGCSPEIGASIGDTSNRSVYWIRLRRDHGGQLTRWLYHIVGSDHRAHLVQSEAGALYAPPSLAEEGFIHASYQPALRDSIRIYFSGGAHSVLKIDPRRLTAAIDVADTPRGPMPHILGPIPVAAIVEVLSPETTDSAPDEINSSIPDD